MPISWRIGGELLAPFFAAAAPQNDAKYRVPRRPIDIKITICHSNSCHAAAVATQQQLHQQQQHQRANLGSSSRVQHNTATVNAPASLPAYCLLRLRTPTQVSPRCRTGATSRTPPPRSVSSSRPPSPPIFWSAGRRTWAFLQAVRRRAFACTAPRRTTAASHPRTPPRAAATAGQP